MFATRWLYTCTVYMSEKNSPNVMSHLICLKNNINYIMDFFCIMAIINMISSVSDLVQMIKWSISTDAQLHHRMYGMWILLWKIYKQMTNANWSFICSNSFRKVHWTKLPLELFRWMIISENRRNMCVRNFGLDLFFGVSKHSNPLNGRHFTIDFCFDF